ncbi:MAG: type II CRISPR RNA-guided endonuclease Cas9 [Eubacteriales bacterium]
MKKEKTSDYFIGFDVGTNSVGYAVTDEDYSLLKYHGKLMWGSHIFDEGETSQKRRAFRTARRRLDRRQQRVALINDFFAVEICKKDPDYFIRRRESSIIRDDGEKTRLFADWNEEKEYFVKYPTIYHLLDDLENDPKLHDVRLVHIACAWLVAHRGHFLSEVSKDNIGEVTDFDKVWNSLCSFISENSSVLPWNADIPYSDIADVLSNKASVTEKTKALSETLFPGTKSVPKGISDGGFFDVQQMIKLLCGAKCKVSDIFEKPEYDDIASFSLGSDDETIAASVSEIDDNDAEFIYRLKAVYDWSVLVDILSGKSTISISKSKVADYDQHKADLAFLKALIRRYIPEKYNEIFRADNVKENYRNYVESTGASKSKVSKTDFSKYLKGIVSKITPDESDKPVFDDMLARLDRCAFLPKQHDTDNRVIPYQLYYHELDMILKNAEKYLPFLSEKDQDGLTVSDKIRSVFLFRVPYFVGPLCEKSKFAWIRRKSQGKIYPWNFEERVDLDASEEEFIRRMTNTCTYLPGEPVLPKKSLCYTAFQVLNEINCIKINECPIDVQIKQQLYDDLFKRKNNVTPKMIREYLKSNNRLTDSDTLTGIDESVKSNLRPFRQFAKLLENGILTTSEVERIIERAACSEEKSRFILWLGKEFPSLTDDDMKYIASLSLKDYGRLSRKFLCELIGTDKKTGESFSIMTALWETNCNLMQLLSDRFTFREQIDEFARQYYNANPKNLSDRLDDMYISNSVKRPIIRTLDILSDIEKIMKRPPKKIFIEMARGASEEQKNKRTISRLAQIRELYQKIKSEDVRELSKQLDDMGESANNRLQSKALFLYYMQLGKCLYTGTPLKLTELSDKSRCNIEHIYPQSYVKDDSLINNEILVLSEVNGQKSDTYPVSAEIQKNMRGYWESLRNNGLMSDEKFRRLTRTSGFTDEEKLGFINRQLVETRQSTKALTEILREKFGDATEIVFVKAGLTSDFRNEFELPKSRILNDLHHAKDAYLNIVTGNVYNSRFSKQWFRVDERYSIKTKTLFTHPVMCGSECVWNGASDLGFVKKVINKNTVNLTKYPTCRQSGQNGGFFDQNPLKRKEGLTPIKAGLPTEKYGGFDNATASFWVLARYKTEKKSDVMFVPVELLVKERFLKDNGFAAEYLREQIGKILEKNVDSVEAVLNKRIIRVNSVIYADGLRMLITSKTNGGKGIGVSVMSPLIFNNDKTNYLKRLESYSNKKDKNDKLRVDSTFDKITKEENEALYDTYCDKLRSTPYNKRPNNPLPLLEKSRAKFEILDVDEQVVCLMEIHGLFSGDGRANLKAIEGGKAVGVTTLNAILSNWKKYYTDVRLIDTSASGLFESMTDNLLELL